MTENGKMKRWLLLLLFVGEVQAQLVLHVGWDGADCRRVSQMLVLGELPNLNSLGHFQCLQILDPTVTKPSWTTQLTGLPATVHGTLDNKRWRPAPEGWTIFENLLANGIQSSYVSGKCHPERGTGNMCPFEGYPLEGVNRAAAYVASQTWNNDAEITAACIDGMATISWRGYAFCHYPRPDLPGHKRGGDSSAYDQALRDNDAELGVLLSSILSPEAIVLVTSDHGFERAGNPNEKEHTFHPWRPRRGSDQQEFGHGHTWQPRAILASSIPLLQSATGRQIAKTVYGILGVNPPEPTPEGRSLLP